MSSQPVFKAPRALSVIQQEYTQLSVRLGHTQYQLATLRKDREALEVAMRDLNAEAYAVQQAEAEAKAAADKAKQEEEAAKPASQEAPKAEEAKAEESAAPTPIKKEKKVKNA